MNRFLDPDYFEDLRLPSAAGTSKEQVGVLVHDLVSAIAARHGGCPDPNQVKSAAREFEFGPYPPTIQMARRQRATTLAAVYFRRFARKGWTYVGSEVITGDVAFDLLWEQRGSLEADEIKTGTWAAGVHKTEAQAQAFGQARAGAELFGTRFRGVRLVLLKAPATAEFVTPEGIWS